MGRKPRADRPNDARIEVRLTLTEARDVREMARRHGCTVADLMRMALLDSDIELEEPLSLVRGQDLIDRVVARELKRRSRIVAGHKKPPVIESVQE